MLTSMRDMSIEQMIAVLDDPDQMLGWKGTPAGPELAEKAREWAFVILPAGIPTGRSAIC